MTTHGTISKPYTASTVSMQVSRSTVCANSLKRLLLGPAESVQLETKKECDKQGDVLFLGIRCEVM